MPDTPQPPTKQALRAHARALRAALTPDFRAAASHAATQHLLASDFIRSARTLAAYASMGDELDTHELIASLLTLHKTVALPRVNAATRQLDLIPITQFPAGCTTSPYGILEADPATPPLPLAAFDLILVPGLLFDRDR